MPTMKKHPSLYDPTYFVQMRNAVKHTHVTIEFNSPAAAKKSRLRFYLARLALYKNPEFDKMLAVHARQMKFNIEGNQLIIRMKR